MKFPKDKMLSITYDDEPEGFEIVHESDWTVEGKSECRGIIFKHDENYYRLDLSRSRFCSDYVYDSDDWEDEVEVVKVRPVSRVIVDWEVIE